MKSDHLLRKFGGTISANITATMCVPVSTGVLVPGFFEGRPVMFLATKRFIRSTEIVAGEWAIEESDDHVEWTQAKLGQMSSGTGSGDQE